MPFELRLAIVALAAFVWAGAAGTLLAAWLWRRPCRADAAGRAARLLRLRLLPVASGGAASTLAIVSFVLYEPRQIDETAGWILTTLATMGAALMATAFGRAVRIAIATARAWQIWRRTASPIAVDVAGVPAFAVTSPFPVVAVVGFWRPRLVIARSVLAACTPDELDAILRHERHHLERRDNLRRALLSLVPDLLCLLPASRRWLRAWHEATEEAADDFARCASASGGVVLAQALLKVARLTPSGSCAATLPASALYRGENLERRVRRLLQPPGELPDRHGRRWPVPAMAAVAYGAGLLALERIHQLVETAVNALP